MVCTSVCCVRRGSFKSVAGRGLIALGVMAGSGPAYAIPSPELVIGSISSLAQLGTLLAALFGGGVVAISARAGWRHGQNTSRRLVKVVFVLFGIAAVLGGLNVYQIVQHRAQITARLQATLVRPARLPGEKVLDPTLEQISYAEQLTHPLGISTEDAARLSEKGDTIFLDIRETGEHETGSLPGARHVRFPDFQSSGIDLAGRKAVLFCHNGNRSYETCKRLAGMGIDCSFIRGGIEKWIVEGRPFTDRAVRTLADLRALPAYRNASTLLDTADARQLIDHENATIVDVRYPGAFAFSHLPGAVNIPIRATASAELASLIRQLPASRPVLAACYDRRSCFSSQVLGLELFRAGLDFRGRYTLPWEYFKAKPAKPHIAAWLAEQQRGPWQHGVDIVAGWLKSLADHIGLVLAILAAAIVSRALVLPISVKAERDQIVMRQNAAAFADLKASLRHDPKRMARAIRAFYAEHGLTPMRNLLALAFLPLMAVTLSAVENTAKLQMQGFAWLSSPGERDGTLLIPVAFGALAALYLDLVFAKTARQRLIVWLIGAPALAAVGAFVSAAGGLYLVASMVLLLAQRSVVCRQPAWLFSMPENLRKAYEVRAAHSGVVPLDCVSRLEGCGNKALRLGVLRRNGVPVPDGVVLNESFLRQFAARAPERRQNYLERAVRRLGGKSFAVRSSASAEDGGANSFAGVFESVLNVQRDGLADAVAQVVASFHSARSETYCNTGGAGNVLIQEMVDADYSGVLFTRDPAGPGAMLVELVEGTADGLVSGCVAPVSLRFGIGSLVQLGETEAPIDLSPLLDIAKRCEALFGQSQDIEWVCKDGRFMIVQSRDITALAGSDNGAVAREWQRLVDLAGPGEAGEVILHQDAMSEVLPQPTPYSFALMQRLWASGGSVDLACRQLGLRYPVCEDTPTYLVTVFGRLYTDPRCEHANAAQMSKLAARQLRRTGGKIADTFEREFLPAFAEEVSLLEAVDFGKLDRSKLFELVETIADSFVHETHAQVETINIAAAFFLSEARRQLEASGLPPARWLSCDAEPTPVRAIRHALSLPDGERQTALVAAAGHRSAFDYELSMPRFKEDPDALANHCGAFALLAAPVNAGQDLPVDVNQPSPTLTSTIGLARRFELLKETAKDQSLRQLAILRAVLLALDEKLGLEGGIFYLTPSELAGARRRDNPGAVVSLVAQRKQHRFSMLDTPPLPARLTRSELETASIPGLQARAGCEGRIAGNLVAGCGNVIGRARVADAVACEAGARICDFNDGDILVCKMVHPAWLGHVIKSGGVVCEVGGWLSHMAIVAREHNITMITGTSGLDRISDGASVRLTAAGEVDVLDTNTESKVPGELALTG